MKAVFLFAALAMSGALAGVVPVASASPYGYPRHPLGLLGHPAFAPVAPAAVAKVARAPVDEFDPNPQYTYGYEIQHAITGDSKIQQETRSGGVVQGSYSVVDPDGYRRIVEYIADSQHWFNAVVHKQTLAAVNAPRVVLH